MGVNRRLAISFLLLLLLLVVVNIAMANGILYSSQYFIPDSIRFSGRDFLVQLVDETKISSKQIQVNPALLKKLEERGEWIQILDENGQEVYAYNRPEHIPKKYHPGKLADFQQDQKENHGYDIHTWYKKTGSQTYTWVYGERVDRSYLLPQAISQTQVNGDRFQLSQKGKSLLQQHQAWMQIIDENGKELYQYNRPAKIPAKYSPGEFVQLKAVDNQFIYQTKEINGKSYTWLLGFYVPQSTLFEERKNYALTSFWVTISGMLVSTVVIAFIFGHRLGKPILHIINWISQLAQGRLNEPVDARGIPKSLHPRKQKIRRSYRMYREVLESLKQLTENLRKNEENRQRLEKTREEWIAGISHDLKTPLSSVIGYAHLLAESSYDWTREEVRSYAKVIQEKANYMNLLIEDLNLTFRMKNDALPMQRTKQNLVELVRRTVIDWINNPCSEGISIEFHTFKEKIYYPVDSKWFLRALHNLIGNAVMHNPKGTRVLVEIEENENQILITIQDNGRGMDEETRMRLFDRYYRGTHTRAKETGTGLGMAIAHQLICAHGGTIQVDSELGKGTRMYIQFNQEKD